MQDIENQPICEENAQAIDPAQAGAEAVNVENAQEPAAEPPVAEKMADRAELDRLTAEANAAAAKRDEYLTMAQRVQADFENYRRRNQNVRKEAFDDGARAFATTLLSVMDNMERAIAAAADSPDASLKEGVQMVCRQMSDAFEKRGITVIDRKGQPFDPNLESAVMQGAPEDGEPGTVCEVLQKGYQLEGIVIRHAMVKVVPE
ncbi:MAG: nucleotide exchange factor GrpE [Clostridia bacterium]